MSYTVEQHIDLRRVGEIAASPDGRWLAAAVQRLDRDRARYVSDLWKLPIDGSAPVQLTRGDSRDGSPRFRRDGALGFLSNRAPKELAADEDADKRMQVWLLPAQGGEACQLTDEPLGVKAFRFARETDRLVVLAPVLAGIAHDKQREEARQRRKHGPSARLFTRQPVRHWDEWLDDGAQAVCMHLVAYEAPSESASGRLDLTPNARREFAIDPEFDLSADGRWVAVTHAWLGADRCDNADVMLIDTASAAARPLASVEASNCQWPRFSPDGRLICVVRSRRSPLQAPHPALALIDVASAIVTDCAPGWAHWPGTPEWSQDGRTVFVCADERGCTLPFAVDIAHGTVQACASAQGKGSYGALVPLASGELAAIRSTSLQAPEAVVLPPKWPAAPRALACLSGLPPVDWAVQERFEVASTDGVPIECLLIKPAQAKGPLPVLLWIHGGPMGASGDGWHWRWNPLLLVAQGYAVAQPNPRGSTGYGQDFVQGIWGNVWGDQCYRDLMAVTDALTRRADLDGTRVGAMGGSFGGYMANWIGTQTDRYRCLISHAGVATMASFTGTTDHPPDWYLEMGGENPYADPEHFDRFAPIRQVARWRSPTLIIHGERDYRCPIGDGLSLFEALQYHGVASELLVFPDENHWILKPRNIIAWYQAVLRFLDRHLRPG